MTTKKKYVLQLCHGYTMPFLDIARQYANLFENTDYLVITAYLIGKESSFVIEQSSSERVVFLDNKSKELAGLKRKQIKQVQQLCQQYNFEFAIAHRYKSIYIACHIKELPVIGVSHAFNVYQRFMRKYFITRHKKNLSLLGVSNAIRDDARTSLPFFPQQKIQTLYNRINPEQIRTLQIERYKAREYLNIPQEKYVFSNVGRLHPDKDQTTLINAFSKVATKLPNSILVIMGKGKLEQQLKQQVKQLQLSEQVLFLGLVPQAVHYFRAFDSFVLSSNYEPFGMVLLEAIIAELPIIATNVGGAKEIISDENWLFNVGDVDKLAELMLKIHSLGNNEKQTIHKHNLTCLQNTFTDQAVKKVFWQLPFMQNFPR